VSERYDAWARRTVRIQPFWFMYHYWAWMFGEMSWTAEEMAVPLQDRMVPRIFWPSCIVSLLAITGLMILFVSLGIQRF
jgi:hypothetical protein